MPALDEATVEEIIEELGERDGLHFVLVLLEAASGDKGRLITSSSVDCLAGAARPDDRPTNRLRLLVAGEVCRRLPMAHDRDAPCCEKSLS
jgi:hypothetical protein